MQIDADLIKETIEDSSKVFIMAHRNIDLDAFGASLGIYYLCKTLGKDAYLLIDDNTYYSDIKKCLEGISNHDIGLKISTFSHLEPMIDDKTLLFVLDTHLINLVQNIKALDIKNIIVIDHHQKKDQDNINNIYEYINTEYSSTIEIVIELLQTLNIYIHPFIATIMLSGLYIDTNGYLYKTRKETHLSAAYLYESEASSLELRTILKEDFNKYKKRQEVILKAEKINNILIACGDENIIYKPYELAKISDTMIAFNEVRASFTIGKIKDNQIGISARSIGDINVGEIMKELNGGGHALEAATQIEGDNIKEVKNKLLNILNS